MVNNTNICHLLITVIFTEVSCSIMPGIIWFAEYINNNKLGLNSLHILYLIVKQLTSLTRSFQSLLQREIIFCLQILAFSITWKKKKIKNLVGFVKKCFWAEISVFDLHIIINVHSLLFFFNVSIIQSILWRTLQFFASCYFW